MELLDQLENTISALLSRVDALTAENASLKDGQAQALESLAEENNSLREELEQERSRNSNALTRVQALVDRLREHTDPHS